MKLLYLDESGSTGLDLENKQQPYFVLAGVCISDREWHKINDTFEEGKIKIYKEFKDIEIHTNELYNSNPKSPFYKNNWQDNIKILEKLVDLIIGLDIELFKVVVCKKEYKEYLGKNILVDPYLYSFAILYDTFNKKLFNQKEYGIIFCDELKKMEKSLEILYPRLNTDNKNIIEKTFYLNSKKNNFIQIADICSFYINKYNCIINDTNLKSNFKTEHCIKMYKKIKKLLKDQQDIEYIDNFKNYFE